MSLKPMRILALPAVVALLGLVASPAASAAERLELNADKSEINFVGSKPDKSSHKGGFKKFEVEAEADFENPSAGSLKIVIDTQSLWSDNEKLTGHLKNPDFFNVRKYPKAVFESTKIEHTDEEEVFIVGKLTMLGKTEEVKIPVEAEVTEETLSIHTKFKLDRTKWGMDYGKGKINDDVDMEVKLVFKR